VPYWPASAGQFIWFSQSTLLCQETFAKITASCRGLSNCAPQCRRAVPVPQTTSAVLPLLVPVGPMTLAFQRRGCLSLAMYLLTNAAFNRLFSPIHRTHSRALERCCDSKRPSIGIHQCRGVNSPILDCCLVTVL
jgi:hypothetical protein